MVVVDVVVVIVVVVVVVVAQENMEHRHHMASQCGWLHYSVKNIFFSLFTF